MSKHLALAAAVAVAPAMVSAGHFRDVPRDHWAYAAITKLVDNGMIQGKQGNFQGHKAFTRYEMAVVLARYMEKLQGAQGDLGGNVQKTYPLVKRLAKEFSGELQLLGVKHQELVARITSLETRTDHHQTEISQLKALVEENRRILQQAGYSLSPPAATPSYSPAPPAPPPAPPAPVASSYAAAPSAPVGNGFSPAATAYPPVGHRAPNQYAAAPGGFAGHPPAPVIGFAGSQDPAPPTQRRQGSAAQRLQNLRRRARGLLSGGLRRRRPAANPSQTGLQLAMAPQSAVMAPRAAMPPAASPAASTQGFRPMPPAGIPTAGRGQGSLGVAGSGAAFSTRSILDTIDQVRSGQLDANSAGRYAGSAEAAFSGRPAPAGAFPLTKRLFGPVGFGPPASD